MSVLGGWLKYRLRIMLPELECLKLILVRFGLPNGYLLGSSLVLPCEADPGF